MGRISRIISITEKVVPDGKINAGSIFFVADCAVGDDFDVKGAKLAIFMPENQAVAAVEIAKWRERIAKGEFPPVDLRYVIVGDPSINPNERPLPLYRTKRPDGTLSDKTYDYMRVLVRFSDGAPVESPRGVAMRVIDSMCERVQQGSGTPQFSDEDPLAAATVTT